MTEICLAPITDAPVRLAGPRKRMRAQLSGWCPKSNHCRHSLLHITAWFKVCSRGPLQGLELSTFEFETRCSIRLS